MSSLKDFVIFDQGKKSVTFEDLVKKIYDNSAETKDSSRMILAKLLNMINTPQEAAVILPQITDLLEVSVKNDAELNKLAAILGRLIPKGGNNMSMDDILSEEEKSQLLEEAKKVFKG